ncbi:MAG: [FeFe] hydrogenase H-cluster radical SAM maturase HydE [Azospirillaceae bacterium]|nr:[FeFe] hydrogenase H-cluster radical SAM maturase HydE [Azospirillaceae bacterium]
MIETMIPDVGDVARWIDEARHLDRRAVLDLLALPRAALFAAADSLRRARMGDDVFLRGIVEFSNICTNDCLYCGIRRSAEPTRRYRMELDEILDVAGRMARWQQKTIVLQSGELASAAEDRRIGEIVRRIKETTDLAVTLSAGNRPRSVYAQWRDCGMDRYLLRFETSDPKLFRYLHPDCTLEERLRCLHDLRSLGVQVGSGFMIGVPGETLGILADNILLCRDLDLDMIGIGPFISHPGTPLASQANAYAEDTAMYFVAMAVLRLVNPDSHIPATTAFDAILPHEGRDLCLQRGANVFMPNNTPGRYRRDYQLYPNKPCVDEDGLQCSQCVAARIWALGRMIGDGPGHSHKTHDL